MGKNKVKAYPLRLDEELMKKLRTIADKEDRKLSDQITRIVREYINNYEKKNGNIVIGEINQSGSGNSINCCDIT